MKTKVNITPSLEDYLETILFLREKNGTVRVTDVAIDMNISKPSVNKAINNLKSMGLVNHEHYGLLNLSDEGEKLARDVAKRHHMLKEFLHRYLGVEEETAEKEACLMEHAMSLETAQKLSDFLSENFINYERKQP